jgi:hypothetical protein
MVVTVRQEIRESSLAKFPTHGEVRRQKLTVEPRPEPENLNHACILGWPINKPAQKILAMELARIARFIPKPMNVNV